MVDEVNKIRIVRLDSVPSDYSIPLTLWDERACYLAFSTCMTMDKQRKYGALLPYAGPIEPAMLFSWNPTNGYGADIIEVLGTEDDKVLVRGSQHCPGEHLVSIDRFREAVVLSRFKALPARVE